MVASGAAFVATILSTNAQQRPNILWINSDDLGVELGCYGNPDVKTPNIDKLAAQGTLFPHAYAASPVCSASRSAMITGMYPPSINCHNHRTVDKTVLPAGIRPVTEYFQKAGYFCTNGNGHNMKRMGKKDFNFLETDIFDGTDWNQRKEGQPFFAQIQIHEPHRDFVSDPDNPVDPDKVSLPACYPNHPLLRADWAMYLESIQQCDKLVGMFMKRLEEEGLADNTIIFFFGDNGRPHLRDKQFLYEGGLNVPLIVRCPEKIKAGAVDKQLVSLIDVTATSMKLAGIPIPSHIQGNVFMGKKATPRKYLMGFRNRMGNVDDDSRSIRDGRYKLILNRMPEKKWMQVSNYKKLQYPAFTLYNQMYNRGELEEPYSLFMRSRKPEIELYDLKNDKMEAHNLANDPEYKKIKKKLYNTLVSNLKPIEKNMIDEAPWALEQAKASSNAYYKKAMNQRNMSENATDEEIIQYWEKRLLK